MHIKDKKTGNPICQRAGTWIITNKDRDYKITEEKTFVKILMARPNDCCQKCINICVKKWKETRANAD